LQKSHGRSKVPDLAELLWETLLEVEARDGYGPDDPLFVEFRHNILRMIADLELLKLREDGDTAKCA